MEGRMTKGKVLSISEDGKLARVAPVDNIDLVSPYIAINTSIAAGSIAKDDTVAYCLFSDATGLIISKL